MNILFLSIGNLRDVRDKSLYTDFVREMASYGNNVCVVCANEKRNGTETALTTDAGVQVLRVRIGNITKCGLIEKGISTLLIESQFKKAIKKYFDGVRFDLVVYSTPPITFAGVIQYVKKRDGAASYLLLKDIFPQNAVDIGMMTKRGPKSVIYKMFRNKEKRLYRLSDHIGCMSPANVAYLLRHNPYVDPQIVHVNPNSMEVAEYTPDADKKAAIYQRYNIPASATTFIYGGNLGRPQGIPFLIECLKANADREDRYFIVCGTGTEYPKLKAYVEQYRPRNVLLLNGLPRAEYSDFVKAFDVGLIFLDHRFTIPNFPSRLLSYMQARMPVLACTDPNTDIGQVITEGGFGWWCESNSVADFTAKVEEAIAAPREAMGDKGYAYLAEQYSSARSYDILMKHL